MKAPPFQSVNFLYFDSHASALKFVINYAALAAREAGSVVFTGGQGSFAYTYVPVESTDDVCLILDHQTDGMEYVSPNAERVLGIRPEDLIGFLADDEAADPDAALYYGEVVAPAPGQAAKPRNTERVNPKTGERRYFKEARPDGQAEGRHPAGAGSAAGGRGSVTRFPAKKRGFSSKKQPDRETLLPPPGLFCPPP